MRKALVLACLFVWASAFANAEVPAWGGKTALMLLEDGQAAFAKSDYASAEKLFREFIDSYGASEEIQPLRERVYRILTMCLLQQHKHADALEGLDVYLNAFPKGEAAEDFRFWRGICLLKEGDNVRAREALQSYLDSCSAGPKTEEARLAVALAFISEGKHDQAQQWLRDRLHEGRFGPNSVPTARIMRLYCLGQMNNLDEALALIGEIDAGDPALRRVAAFHLLALDIGGRLFEAERHRDALKALQKVWSRKRVVSRQGARLKQLQEELEALGRKNDPDPFQEFMLRSRIEELGQELGQLEKIPDYDTALNFRVALCFFKLSRFREAYLVIKRMLEGLPDGEMAQSAHYHMLICSTRMEQWDETNTAAEAFVSKNPKHALVPNALYMKAEALMRLLDYDGARQTFERTAKEWPKFQEAERCHFMAGYCLLLMEHNEEAFSQFEKYEAEFPKGEFLEDARFWKGMAWHFNADYEKSREVLGACLASHPDGKYADEAVFRRAQCLFHLKRFVDAYKELESFLAKYPEARVVDEARNALGDCYLALGEVERALGAFAQTSKADLALFDYAWFRCGKAYRALEDYGKFQSHFETFLKERDNSPRVAEAIGQLAWLYRNQGRIEQARDLYWNAIERYGHDPEAGAVEELFLTVAKYYGNPESQKTFLNRLANLAEDAADKKPALAARARWMRARFFAKTDLKASQDELLRIPELGPPHEFSARALADIADALRAKGRAKDAEEWYWTLLRWHPQSLLKDRAWAGLGLLAREQGKNKKALEYFNLFEKKTTGSPLLADVLQARASIYEERSDWESAVAQLGRVLELPNAGSRAKAETLYRMGELYLRGGNPKQAIGCFQRIYVMYRRWEDVMVKAYWQSGRAFESLNMPTEAAGTYKELLLHTHLEKKPEYAMAQKRLNEIGIP